MGDATEEKYELEDGPGDSQQPLTVGYEKDDFDKKASEKNTKKDVRSFCLSVFNLMNAILGSGILGLAEAMKNLGVALFYVLLLMTACLAGYTINLLLQASKASGEIFYERLAQKAFGIPGKIATSIMIMFHCFGAMCSYVYIIKAELPEVVNVFINNATTHGAHDSLDAPWYLEGTFLMMIVVVLVIFPFSALRDIRILGYSSAFGMFCMLLFTFTVVAKKFSIPCPLENETESHELLEKHDNISQSCQADVAVINRKSAFAVPTMMFAFMCHASMLPIYSELRRPSPKKMKQVAGVSIFLVLALYLLSASFGYFTFYNYVESELLLTYSLYEPSDPAIILSRITVLICVILSTPLLHYPCRKTIVTTFLKPFLKNHEAWYYRIAVTIANLFVVVLLVTFIPNIRDIFGIAGATSSTSLLIIFPCAFYLKLVKKPRGRKHTPQRILVKMLLAIGIIFMVTSVALIILDWVTPDL